MFAAVGILPGRIFHARSHFGHAQHYAAKLLLLSVFCETSTYPKKAQHPVVRVQDSAIKRPSNETVTVDGDMVTGVNTSFTQLFKDGDKLRFRGKSEQLKVPCVCHGRRKSCRHWNYIGRHYVDIICCRVWFVTCGELLCQIA